MKWYLSIPQLYVSFQSLLQNKVSFLLSHYDRIISCGQNFRSVVELFKVVQRWGSLNLKLIQDFFPDYFDCNLYQKIILDYHFRDTKLLGALDQERLLFKSIFDDIFANHLRNLFFFENYRKAWPRFQLSGEDHSSIILKIRQKVSRQTFGVLIILGGFCFPS